MAIDDAEKRRSASGVKRLGARVTPNSAKDAQWRKQAGWNYSGFASGAPLSAYPFYRGLLRSPGRLLH